MFHVEQDCKSFEPELVNLIKQRKCEQVLWIIKGRPVNELIDSNGTHLLHLAAKYNNIGLINYLIKSGCKPNVEDSSKVTPLLTAIVHKNFDAAKALQIAHMDLHEQLAKANEPFCGLIYLKPKPEKPESSFIKELVSMMRESQLSPERIGEALAKISGCLLNNVIQFHDPAITDMYLRSASMQTHFVDNRIFKALMDTFNVQHISLLLHHKETNYCSCAFRVCCSLLYDIEYYHKTRSGRMFLKKMFSCEVFREENLKLLELALTNSKRKSLKIFLKYKFHIAAKDKYGRDLLACLFAHRDPKVINLLKAEEIDVNGRGYEDNTPLHFAAKYELFDNMRLLLDEGANPNALNEHRKTPLWVALITRGYDVNNDEKCIKLLLQSGADVICSNDESMSKSYEYLLDIWSLETTNVAEFAAAKLVIDEALGINVQRISQQFIVRRLQKMTSTFDDYRQQLNTLKSRNIRNSNNQVTRKKELNMFTILTERPENIARYINKDELQAISRFIETNEDKLAPYFCDLLRKSIEDVTKLICWRNAAKHVVSQCTGINDPHSLIVEKIVSFFNIDDMRTFLPRFEGLHSASKSQTKHWLKLTK